MVWARGPSVGAMVDAGMAMAHVATASQKDSCEDDLKTCDETLGVPVSGRTELEMERPPRGAAVNLSSTCATASMTNMPAGGAVPSPTCQWDQAGHGGNTEGCQDNVLEDAMGMTYDEMVLSVNVTMRPLRHHGSVATRWRIGYERPSLTTAGTWCDVCEGCLRVNICGVVDQRCAARVVNDYGHMATKVMGMLSPCASGAAWAFMAAHLAPHRRSLRPRVGRVRSTVKPIQLALHEKGAAIAASGLKKGWELLDWGEAKMAIATCVPQMTLNFVGYVIISFGVMREPTLHAAGPDDYTAVFGEGLGFSNWRMARMSVLVIALPLSMKWVGHAINYLGMIILPMQRAEVIVIGVSATMCEHGAEHSDVARKKEAKMTAMQSATALPKSVRDDLILQSDANTQSIKSIGEVDVAHCSRTAAAYPVAKHGAARGGSAAAAGGNMTSLAMISRVDKLLVNRSYAKGALIRRFQLQSIGAWRSSPPLALSETRAYQGLSVNLWLVRLAKSTRKRVPMTWWNAYVLIMF